MGWGGLAAESLRCRGIYESISRTVAQLVILHKLVEAIVYYVGQRSASLAHWQVDFDRSGFL